MRVVLAILAACAGLAAVSAAPRPNQLQPAWLGSTVLARRADVPVEPLADRPRRSEDVAPPAGMTVLAVDGDLLQVQFGWLRFIDRGWVKKADVVPIDAADGVFGRLIEEDPQNAWAFVARGLARTARYLEKRDEQLAQQALDDFQKAAELSPHDPLPLLHRASLLMVLQRSPEAAESLDAAEKVRPDEAATYVLRAHLHADFDHDYVKAREQCGRALQRAPRSVAALELRSQTARAERQWDAALTDLDAAIKCAPFLGGLYVDRGKVRAAKQDLPGALADYSQALECDDAPLEALVLRGETLNDLGRHDEAERDFVAALEVDSRLPEAWLGRGEAHLGRGRIPEALKDIDQSIRLDRKYAPAWMVRGGLHSQQGQFAEAVFDFTKAIEATPDDPHAYHARAVARGALREFDAALTDLRRCCELDPKQIPPRVTRARLLVEHGRARQALRELDQALSVVRDPLLLECRALAYMDVKEPDKALADLNELLERNPKSAAAFGIRALIHIEQGRPDEGLADLDQSIKLQPTAPAYLARAELHAQQGRTSEALRDAKRAMYWPSHAAAARALSARIHGERGNLAKSVAEMRKAVELAPSSAEAHAQLATALLDNGQFDEALNEAGLAVRLDPELPLAYRVRAALWQIKSEYRRARDDLDEYVRLTEGKLKADALLQRADIYVRLGDPVAALRDADEALGLVKDSEAVRRHAGIVLETGDVTRCLAGYEESLRLDANNALTYRDRSSVLVIQGRWDEALADADQVIRLGMPAEGHRLRAQVFKFRNDGPQTLAEANEALRLDPNLHEAYVLRSAANWMLKRFREALDDADSALRLAPDLANYHRARAMALTGLGLLNDAKASVDEALRLNPSYDWAYDTRARIQLLSGDMAGAIRDADEALRLNPRIPDAHITRINALLSQGDTRRASEACAVAVATMPLNVDLLKARASVALRQGDHASSLRDAREVGRLAPDDAEGHLLQARSLLLGKRPGEALAELERTLQLGYPHAFFVYWLQGDCHMSMDDDAQAAAAYEQTIMANPRFVPALLGLAHLRACSFDDAVRQGSHAVELAKQALELSGGKDVTALATLAEALAESGDFPAAIDHQRSAVEQCVNEPARRVALEDTLRLFEAGKPLRRRAPFLPPPIETGESEAEGEEVKPPLDAPSEPAEEVKPPLDAPSEPAPAPTEEVKPPLR